MSISLKPSLLILNSRYVKSIQYIYLVSSLFSLRSFLLPLLASLSLLITSTSAGVVGRIIWGVIQKIFVAIKVGGAVTVHGELIDSTAYLAVLLISLVHNFNMNSLGNLDVWVRTIESDVKDLAVSKHIFHIRECQKICREMGNYLRPFDQLATDMLSMESRTSKNVTEGMMVRFLHNYFCPLLSPLYLILS